MPAERKARIACMKAMLFPLAAYLRGAPDLVREAVVVHEGPSARIVGLHGSYPISLRYGPDPYVEGLNRPGIAVPSLYEYQLRQRLAREAADRSTP